MDQNRVRYSVAVERLPWADLSADDQLLDLQFFCEFNTKMNWKVQIK